MTKSLTHYSTEPVSFPARIRMNVKDNVDLPATLRQNALTEVCRSGMLEGAELKKHFLSLYDCKTLNECDTFLLSVKSELRLSKWHSLLLAAEFYVNGILMKMLHFNHLVNYTAWVE